MGLLFPEVPDSEVVSDEDLYHSARYRESEEWLKRVLQGLVTRHPNRVSRLSDKDNERCDTIFWQYKHKSMNKATRFTYEKVVVILRDMEDQ